MSLNPRWGYAAAAAWLVTVFAIGVYIPGADPGEIKQWKEGEFRPVNEDLPEFYQKDQLRARSIVKEGRRIDDEREMLTKRYRNIPEFTPPEDGRFTREHIKKYIETYKSYVEQRKRFDRKLGNSPSIFSIFAVAGVITAKHNLWEMNALVKNNIRKEEFEWIRDRLFEAGYYCVKHKIENENLPPKQHERLSDLKDTLEKALGIKKTVTKGDEEVTVYRPDKLDLSSIPRRNIELFLENYLSIHYSKVHYDRPVEIKFDKAAIMASASNNPP